MNATKIPAQFTEPSAAVQDPQELGIISELTKELVEIDDKIERLKSTMEQLADRRKQVAEVLIPDHMSSLGVAAITTIEGHKLEVKPFYQASIKRLFEKGPYDPNAYAWLEQNGHGGVIKTAVEVTFGRGELDEAKSCVAMLKTDLGLGNRVSLEQSVHAQTLKALCREIMERGEALPESYFKVYTGRQAVVKASKQSHFSIDADSIDA